MKDRPFVSATLLALVTLGALVSSAGTARAERIEFPTLARAIELARARALVVADAQAELGVAKAQVAGARVSALGNPYVEVQVDKGLGATPVSQLQAIAYMYFPVDLGGQRGARIE